MAAISKTGRRIRLSGLLATLIGSVVALLMPKCPVCLMAYASLFGGLAMTWAKSFWPLVAIPLVVVLVWTVVRARRRRTMMSE